MRGPDSLDGREDQERRPRKGSNALGNNPHCDKAIQFAIRKHDFGQTRKPMNPKSTNSNHQQNPEI
jgi:hypothetical protein